MSGPRKDPQVKEVSENMLNVTVRTSKAVQQAYKELQALIDQVNKLNEKLRKQVQAAKLAAGGAANSVPGGQAQANQIDSQIHSLVEKANKLDNRATQVMDQGKLLIGGAATTSESDVQKVKALESDISKYVKLNRELQEQHKQLKNNLSDVKNVLNSTPRPGRGR